MKNCSEYKFKAKKLYFTNTKFHEFYIYRGVPEALSSEDLSKGA